jgi:hypothetical protein
VYGEKAHTEKDSGKQCGWKEACMEEKKDRLMQWKWTAERFLK